MFLLGALDLIKPDPGLFIWTVAIFVLLWIILGKYAFGPIGKALAAREDSIKDALASAEKAKEEMAALKSDNDKLLNEAREERAKMLKSAKDSSQAMIDEAKDKARAEAKKITEESRREINSMKLAAMTEVKNEVGKMAVDVSEKILKRELNANTTQDDFIQKLVDDLKLN